MAARYWVGGTAAWDATAGTKWALTDGGAGGQAVPTSADDVYFTAASGAVTVTTSTSGGCLCQSLNFTGFTGTFTGATFLLDVYGSLTLSSTMTWSHTGGLAFQASTGSYTISLAGKSLGAEIVNFGAATGSTALWTLQDAFTSTQSITVTRGTFTTNNYAVTATSLSSSNSNTRTINLGSSTVTLSASGATPTVSLITTSNLTFNAGTSQLTLTNATAAINSGGVTFYNVSYTSTALTTPSIGGGGANVFNNLTIAGRTSAGVTVFQLSSDQTINGTLTLSAGTNATMRTFLRSDTIGTTRTLTCAAAASPTDIDFRDITIAGAAAPVSGTRLGDCKGNSGITFPAAKTVYWNISGGNWGSAAWASTSNGTTDINQFPLAQDTAVFIASSTKPSSGTPVTINAAYNIGTVDMSARTASAPALPMILATGSTTPAIYGNWINGTGTTLTGTGAMTFAGRGSQTITSAGKTFTQSITINSPGGSVTLQDAFVTSATTTTHTAGTFDANGYNVTSSGSFNTASSSSTRTVAIGSGTWTFSGSGNMWQAAITGLTVTGTGTISLTSASSKTFTGGGIQTYPTINQGGTGALTITGSNKFANITNTAIGSVLFTGDTTNEFTAFNLNGTSTAARLTLGSTNTTQAILKKPSAWNVGAGSLDSGNNTGLTFTAGGGIDFLNISYINGQISATPTVTYLGNFFVFF